MYHRLKRVSYLDFLGLDELEATSFATEGDGWKPRQERGKALEHEGRRGRGRK